MIRHTLLFLSVIVPCVAACSAPASAPRADTSSLGACIAADGHPVAIDCTGLYADVATGAISSDAIAYAPAVGLWADGATKRRFIRLPPGTAIDTHDMDHWVFPNGTKIWKELSLGGRKIETRYLEKRSDGTWFRTVYAWNADQTAASEVTTGVTNVNGSGYDIPSQDQCAVCHAGEPDQVLGFEAVGLSAPGATGLTLDELANEGLLSAPPAAPIVVPGTPAESAALAWLHANCGNACHNGWSTALARSTGLFMRLTVGQMQSVTGTDTYRTAVGVVSGFEPAPNEPLDRILPGDPAHSAIVYRASRRDTPGAEGIQMPPIGTHVVDAEGVGLVEAWIQGM